MLDETMAEWLAKQEQKKLMEVVQNSPAKKNVDMSLI